MKYAGQIPALAGLACAALLLPTGTANASVIAIGPASFPAGAPTITFTGLADGTEVNGLSMGGVSFSYSLGNGIVSIDGGPGPTNNITPPNVVSIGDASGILNLSLPGFSDRFGYGYAILAGGPVSNATTITLFNGTTNVGSLSYNGAADPNFTGGFAGIQSTISFNAVAITFNAAVAPAFALDNIRFASAVPEPATSLLVAAAAVALCCARKRRPV